MARWLRDRLLFRSAKPVPPEPDYYAVEEPPDLLAAYRLQRERDFEDPYAGGAAAAAAAQLTPADTQQQGGGRRCRSPRRRLIRVEAATAAPGMEGDPPAGTHEKMLVMEDYADPFDTRPKSSSLAGEPEKMNGEGYMEPYEAQKLLAESQKKGSKEELASPRPLHLYDVPYEPDDGTEPNSPCPPGARCRNSWLPEEDERPPEEYDQPWEWKKERISRVFAGQGTGKSPLPSCEEKSVSPCRSSAEHGRVFGERVNPTLPLESQAWYHGTLSRADAEGLLRLCREASYLVRNSESSHDAFSLSLKSNQGFLHMKLLPTEDNKFVLGQHSPPFDNVPEIIHHYASHKLPIQGAEHISLLYPVTAQPSSCLAAEP
ncbi:hypothetical protein JRQ81_006806 [Phrynocephalus forsythii]|uniref:SH2 domain-containing adapter protein D n=1 Tax=Phrynocephalus forsythii TaxID=171643 RepID=A0A9Q1ATU9_9SAUR|nr:hypothetical protein JRQ81_006806 [Phrynocephalus forsythii]